MPLDFAEQPVKGGGAEALALEDAPAVERGDEVRPDEQRGVVLRLLREVVCGAGPVYDDEALV